MQNFKSLPSAITNCGNSSRAYTPHPVEIDEAFSSSKLNRRQLLLMLAAASLSACGSAKDELANQVVNPTRDSVKADRTQKLQSFYVPMRDGVRIAVDLWLPPGALASKVPTVARMTRYLRAPAVESTALPDNPNFEEASLWLQRGYALLIIDARGSGASFGSRPQELDPAEIIDYSELISWIGVQPWSNERVGVYGGSYEADAAELVARLGNPYLKASAPLFGDFDPFRQILYPGGVYAVGFAPLFEGVVQGLDGIDGALERFAAGPFGRGRTPAQLIEQGAFPSVLPAPVQGPNGLALRAAAIREHQTNAPNPIATSPNRNIAIYDNFAIPTHQKALETANVPMFFQIGWLDAGTAAGMLERFTNFSTSQDVWLGPWDHGAQKSYDFTRPDVEISYLDLRLGERFNRIVEFFDTYLRSSTSAPRNQKRLRFTTHGVDGWRETSQWPLPGVVNVSNFFGANTLRAQAIADILQVPVPTSIHISSEVNRWTTQLGTQVDYSQWASAAGSRVSFTGPVLTADVTVLGFPVVTVEVTTDQTDGVLFAYLEKVTPAGEVQYITEGMIRLLHRGRVQPAIRTDQRLNRSFASTDVLTMVPGQATTVVFELFPTSVRLEAGARLQISFASSDQGNFARYPAPSRPDAPPARLTLNIRPGQAAHLTLPTLTT
jgi:uncharacterized protein